VPEPLPSKYLIGAKDGYPNTWPVEPGQVYVDIILVKAAPDFSAGQFLCLGKLRARVSLIVVPGNGYELDHRRKLKVIGASLRIWL